MMYEELVKRLRARAKREDDYYEHGGDVINEAADAIEELNGKMRLYSFIWTHLPKGELDMLLYMYREQEEA